MTVKVDRVQETILAILLLLLIPLATGCNTAPADTGNDTSGPSQQWNELLTAQPLPTVPPLPTMPPLATMTFSPAPPPTRAPSPVPTEYGIQIHGCGYDPETALDLVQQAGFTWVKQQVRWEDLEGERGMIGWDCIDRVVDGAHRRDLKVLLSVVTSPAWARTEEEAGHPWNPTFFAQFCMQLTDRYRGRIHAIEVFNEPNLEREWGPFMNPGDYGAMLEWTYYAIKQTAPEVMVISAGLAPTEWNAWDVALPDDLFLEELVAQGGLQWTDCIGVHFNHGTESPLVEGGQFEELILGYQEIAEGTRPLCLTEFGYAVPRNGELPEGFEWASQNTAEEQAQWLADGWTWAERHPGVLRLVIVWNLNYWSENPQDPNLPYTLWTPRGLMPAYQAVQDANSRMREGER